VHVIASFPYSTYLEIAIAELEEHGIPRSRVMAVPLERRPSGRSMIDTMYRSDGSSLLDIGMALGTATSVVTASLGMTLAWGPVYWGLIGAGAGFAAGLLIDLAFARRRRRHAKRATRPEIVLVVDCDDWLADRVADTLWRHQAAGVAVVPSA